MPLYTFELQDGQHPVGDETGVWFADRERALDHAHRVARELMSAREVQTRTWRLDVYEDGSRVVERCYDTLRDFKQAMSVARATMQESRALVARSRGKPYLATDGGKPTMAVSFQSQKCSEKN
jgi:hypothetical protein